MKAEKTVERSEGRVVGSMDAFVRPAGYVNPTNEEKAQMTGLVADWLVSSSRRSLRQRIPA